VEIKLLLLLKKKKKKNVKIDLGGLFIEKMNIEMADGVKFVGLGLA
jgi:hypothetical protein